MAQGGWHGGRVPRFLWRGLRGFLDFFGEGWGGFLDFFGEGCAPGSQFLDFFGEGCYEVCVGLGLGEAIKDALGGV